MRRRGEKSVRSERQVLVSNRGRAGRQIKTRLRKWPWCVVGKSMRPTSGQHRPVPPRSKEGTSWGHLFSAYISTYSCTRPLHAQVLSCRCLCTISIYLTDPSIKLSILHDYGPSFPFMLHESEIYCCIFRKSRQIWFRSKSKMTDCPLFTRTS